MIFKKKAHQVLNKRNADRPEMFFKLPEIR